MDEPSHDPMIGRRIRHYRIQERIGGGRQGVVYRARNERLDCDVALKVVLHGTFPDVDSRRLTEREARALAQISHPSVVVVHDFIDDEPDCDCVVMELGEGRSLKEMMSGSRLPQLDALRLGVRGFGESGDPKALYAKHGLDAAGIAASVRRFLSR